ncbi:MAG: hypothetical protein KC933_34965 [Myxococcales bacterium]|nr:hypothetical protein [Myxococcales bacterium]
MTSHLALAVLATLVAVLCFAHTPDSERGYLEGDGRPAAPGRLHHAVTTILFWAMASAAYGAIAAGLLAISPEATAVAPLAALALGLFLAGAVSLRLLRAGPDAMRTVIRPAPAPTPRGRARVLFICGSPNQTTQMHAISRQMPEVEAFFTPYFGDQLHVRVAKRVGWLDTAILGSRRRRICLDYLGANGLAVDLDAEANAYDLVVSCNDQVIPRCLAYTPMVLVQEGIQDPPNWKTLVWRWTRLIPRPLTGTSTFGLSGAYEKICVASPGYRDNYLNSGVATERVEVTGIPNFDDFERFRDNAFPHQGYVLVCTTDARETMAEGDRHAFLDKVMAIAAGRPLFFKLHPNEDFARATSEIHALMPEAKVFTSGSAEEMVANCDVLITEWSSLTFAGAALGKEVHSHHPMEEIQRLLPLQHGRAAENIARVCRGVLGAHRLPRGVLESGTSEAAEDSLA